MATTTQAALITGTYTFTGNDPAGDAAVPSQANMTYGAFSRTVVTAVSLANVFASTDWSQNTSIDTAQYVQFTLTPNTGFSLSLQSITFDNVKTTGGPTSAQVQIFLGATLISKGSQAFTPGTTTANVNFDFTDFVTANHEAVTVRFYAWNDSGNNNPSLSFDNVVINGSVNPVPEPVNVALVVFGLCVAVGGVGRRVYLRAQA